ncbi:MAG TPA: S8 family serine peptidase [Pirellulales bacterium]|jgi:hypothetical protein|nr:S8 family serine peptidase [Pirellulales bacterium]
MKVVHIVLLAGMALLAAVLLSPSPSDADDADVLAIHGDISRQEFGSGTGVIVGIVDSGVASTHPVLAGNTSLGHPRLLAAANFVGDGDTSATDNSVEGHGTLMASAILSNDPTHTGLAPDAQYINARVLDVNDMFGTDDVVMNGVGYAVSQGANVLNLSLNWGAGVNTNGTDRIDLILDWAAQQGVNIAVAAGNITATRDSNNEVLLQEFPPAPVRSPGSAYNVVTVGRTGVPVGDPNAGPITASTVLNYNQVFSTSASGPINSPTGIGSRDKPDLVAPGTNTTLASNEFTPGNPATYWSSGINGTSVSSALVAGMMAQEIGYGESHGLSTSPLVIKATMMNSADQVLGKVLPSTSGPPNLSPGAPWQPRASSMVGGVLQVTAPLDVDSGAGQVDGAKLFQQYTAGQQGAGTVNPIGWDLNNISSTATTTYTLNAPQAAGSQINVTLDWLRHITWTDSNHNNIADSADIFTPQILSDLNLSVLVNGSLVADSISTTDNEQLLEFLLPQSGTVSIQVNDVAIAGAPPIEQYGLAWSIAAVPEPSAIFLAVCGAVLVGFRKFKRR